jgi:hypothetical protein
VQLAWESQLAVLLEIKDALRALAAVTKLASPTVNTEHAPLEEKQ